MSSSSEAKKLPDKIYFKIGEVSEYTELKAHTIRYWEKEFPQIKPSKRRGQRLYDKETIYQIMRIKRMLHQDNYTIAGAKKKIKDGLPVTDSRAKDFEIFSSILKDLEEIKKILGG